MMNDAIPIRNQYPFNNRNVDSIYKDILLPNDKPTQYARKVLCCLIRKYNKIGKNFYVKSRSMKNDLDISTTRIGMGLTVLYEKTDLLEVRYRRKSGACNLYLTRFNGDTPSFLLELQKKVE